MHNVDVSAGVLENIVKPGTHLEVTVKESMTHEMKQKCRLAKKRNMSGTRIRSHNFYN